MYPSTEEHPNSSFTRANKNMVNSTNRSPRGPLLATTRLLSLTFSSLIGIVLFPHISVEGAGHGREVALEDVPAPVTPRRPRHIRGLNATTIAEVTPPAGRHTSARPRASRLANATVGEDGMHFVPFFLQSSMPFSVSLSHEVIQLI